MKRMLAISLLLAAGCTPRTATIPYGATVEISREALTDKIKGGWAGQTIGCTYGGPTEFKYKGGIIHDQAPMVWYDDYALETFRDDPGLYDDVYMDLTFVEVMARCGVDVPADSLALAFAHADYKLWHANQAARRNILDGIMPPASGHWRHNPHADDIDFQIEADFIGMICPGMCAKAAEVSDRVGHIMNYGDGYYGGLYLGTAYALAFVCDDIPTILAEALKAIPTKSKYYRCIADVIELHGQYPDDWQQCWFEIEKRYGNEKGCPEGVFNGFNIDAAINSAYVVIGLLYGQGDFFRTMDIATRCGQDSDCNPASAAGILGVVKGYEAIPDYWKPALEKVEDMDFPYTSISLRTLYGLNLDLVAQTLASQGGGVDGETYRIPVQRPEAAPYEESFEGLCPVERRVLKRQFRDSLTLDFLGNSVVVMGSVVRTVEGAPDYTARIEASLDGKVVERFDMPYDYIKRRYDVFFSYEIPGRETHTLTLKLVNPSPGYVIEAKEMVVWSAAPRLPIEPAL